MSWQSVSYWSVRCDGDTTRGQCQELLPDVNNQVQDRHGQVHSAPAIFRDKLRVEHLNTAYLEQFGWLRVGGRVLCPGHARALEKQAEAMLDGLPFEEMARP